MNTPFVAYRLAAWDTPLWVNPNRSAGRYNAPGVGPVQYWSLHPLTPWSEYCRAEGLRQPGDVRHLRLRLWVGRFQAAPVVVDFATAADHGVEAADLVDDDHGACRRLGLRWLARTDLPGGVVVPSAALPGTHNLVLFGPRVAAPFYADPVDDLDVPTTVAADSAGPVETLLERVRHRGQPHAGLEAWRAGRTLAFREPPTPLPHR